MISAQSQAFRPPRQAHGYGVRAAVCLAELLAALMASSVQLPLAVVRFCRFSDDGGQGLKGVLGLFLRHLLESLLQRSVDVAPLFAPLRKYGDVREGGTLHREVGV